MIILLDNSDVIEKSSLENYTDQILVLRPEALDEKYRNAEFQLFKASGGFGCDPSKMGTAVFGTFLADGESTRMERDDFLGIVKPESYEQWQKLFKPTNDKS